MVFVLAGALIVLNILVDSFVAVRPGASRAGHVLASVVPIVLTTVAVWFNPRLKAGLRVSIASLFGALALVWGGIAVATAAQEGFGPGGITGFLLIPVGIGLLVLAAATLWRSRRHDRFRYPRAVMFMVVAILAVYWVMLPLGISAYATHRPRASLGIADLPLAYENVTVRTSDGLDLTAWYIPSKNGAAVITFPRDWTAAHAAMLASHGYGVLMLDMRGYGEAEGDANAYGWGASRDIDAGISYLRSRTDVKAGRIGGPGLSVGGEQMIEAAARDPRLKAVVSEGAGERSVRESLLRGPRGYFALPAMAVQTAAIAVLSGDALPPSLEQLVVEVAPRPVFLIFSSNGGGGEELNPVYFAAAGQPKELWEVPGAGHTAGISGHPQEYERRVTQFFDSWLLDR